MHHHEESGTVPAGGFPPRLRSLLRVGVIACLVLTHAAGFLVSTPAAVAAPAADSAPPKLHLDSQFTRHGPATLAPGRRIHWEIGATLDGGVVGTLDLQVASEGALVTRPDGLWIQVRTCDQRWLTKPARCPGNLLQLLDPQRLADVAAETMVPVGHISLADSQWVLVTLYLPDNASADLQGASGRVGIGLTASGDETSGPIPTPVPTHAAPNAPTPSPHPTIAPTPEPNSPSSSPSTPPSSSPSTPPSSSPSTPPSSSPSNPPSSSPSTPPSGSPSSATSEPSVPVAPTSTPTSAPSSASTSTSTSPAVEVRPIAVGLPGMPPPQAAQGWATPAAGRGSTTGTGSMSGLPARLARTGAELGPTLALALGAIATGLLLSALARYQRSPRRCARSRR